MFCSIQFQLKKDTQRCPFHTQLDGQAVISCWDAAYTGTCTWQFRNRHGLKDDMSWSGDNCIKEAFTAEQHIFAPFTAWISMEQVLTHSRQVPGINNHLLSGSQVIFNRRAVNFKESRTAAGQLLHNKPLTAKETGSSLFLEKAESSTPASAARNRTSGQPDRLPGVSQPA